ncbi:MAG: hypothetical protein WC511_02445 [Candidatus Pacearchaeota archaeon]
MKKILIVESNPFRLNTLQKYLSKDITLYVAWNTYEAILLLLTIKDIGLISMTHGMEEFENHCGRKGKTCVCPFVNFLLLVKPICPILLHTLDRKERKRVSKLLKIAELNVLGDDFSTISGISDITDNKDCPGDKYPWGSEIFSKHWAKRIEEIFEVSEGIR